MLCDSYDFVYPWAEGRQGYSKKKKLEEEPPRQLQFFYRALQNFALLGFFPDGLTIERRDIEQMGKQ